MLSLNFFQGSFLKYLLIAIVSASTLAYAGNDLIPFNNSNLRKEQAKQYLNLLLLMRTNQRIKNFEKAIEEDFPRILSVNGNGVAGSEAYVANEALFMTTNTIAQNIRHGTPFRYPYFKRVLWKFLETHLSADDEIPMRKLRRLIRDVTPHTHDDYGRLVNLIKMAEKRYSNDMRFSLVFQSKSGQVAEEQQHRSDADVEQELDNLRVASASKFCDDFSRKYLGLE